MNNVSMDKKYKYRNGTPARILCVDRNSSDGNSVISISEDGDINTHLKDGRYFDHRESNFDLIEIHPYGHIPIDAKVLVWDNLPSDKKKRHFAGINDNGKPTTWQDGTTSWSTYNGEAIEWENCELVEE